MTKRRLIYGLAFTGLVIFALLALFPFAKKTEYANLSHFDLLNAVDVQRTAKQSVLTENPELINQQIEEIVRVAKAMPLHPDSIRFLRGPKATDYLLFQAKRALFDDELEQRFKSLSDIDDLKQKYPEAKDKFERADSMINERDSMLLEIENTLVEQGIERASAHAKAVQLWKEKFSQ